MADNAANNASLADLLSGLGINFDIGASNGLGGLASLFGLGGSGGAGGLGILELLLGLGGGAGGLGGLGGLGSVFGGLGAAGPTGGGRNRDGQKGTVPFSGQGGMLGFGTPEYLRSISGQGIGGHDGQPLRNLFLSSAENSSLYKDWGGDQLRQILSGYGDRRSLHDLAEMDADASRPHAPGDVILSDDERQNIANERTRLANLNAQRTQEMADQWLTDHPAPAQWIDYGITPVDPVDQRPLGTISVPAEWQDAYNTGLQANKDFWADRRHGEDHLNPGNITSSAFDPVWDYNTGLRNANSLDGAKFQVENLINQGRAILDPTFVAPDQSLIEAYNMTKAAVTNAGKNIHSAMQQYAGGNDGGWGAGNNEAATRNQQAYDVLLNKGQEGGIIPQDYSRPFYGQITGQEGVGGQGGTWNGQSLGWSSGYGGLGLGQSSTTPYWQPGGMQQRDDTPTAGWGGVFGQKNPWSFA